jgi:pimeloyl-ACP methyl ester carboxylesterase
MLARTRKITLDQGELHYVEEGDGPPVVFVHGVLANADLWRKVLGPIAEAGFRCLAPDWPLGSHPVPMSPDADLTPPGVARLIADFLEALDLRDVLIVANDTGGAITQILMANHPDRIGGVVLTPSDSFERFFPPAFAPLPKLARLPGSGWLLAATLRSKAVRSMSFRSVTKRGMPDEVVHSFIDPAWRSPGVRRDLIRFLCGVHRRHTLAAARVLGEFSPPVLLAWATEDRLFPLSLARRLAEVLPDARIVEIEDSRTFVPEDQPARLAAHIIRFARKEVPGLAH